MEQHLERVRRCPCVICEGVIHYYQDYEAIAAWARRSDWGIRLSDVHHLPSDSGDRRRSSHQSVVPLCRRHHGFMDTQRGKLIEREQLFKLRRIALELGLLTGITVNIEIARILDPEELRMADFLIDLDT